MVVLVQFGAEVRLFLLSYCQNFDEKQLPLFRKPSQILVHRSIRFEIQRFRDVYSKNATKDLKTFVPIKCIRHRLLVKFYRKIGRLSG